MCLNKEKLPEDDLGLCIEYAYLLWIKINGKIQKKIWKYQAKMSLENIL